MPRRLRMPLVRASQDIYQQPINKETLKLWWDQFQSKHNYPLYCIVLATNSDSEVVSLLQNHRTELAEWSGKDCCFIYFRDLNKAKSLIPFQYQEHTQWVYSIVQLLDIKYTNIPCFLFFERLNAKQFLHINLRGLSEQEIMALIREVFEYVHDRKKVSPFERLKNFQHIQTLSVTGKKIIRQGLLIGRDTLVEMIKSLVVLR